MISLIANTFFTGAGAGGTTPAVNTSGANFTAIAFSQFPGIPPVLPSDNMGNMYLGLTGVTSNNVQSRIFYCINPIVGPGHTFTASAPFMFPTICAAAFSGMDTIAPFDVENGSFNNSASSLQPGSITPSKNGELILSFVGTAIVALNAVDSGMTITDNAPWSPGNSDGGALAYFVQSTAAAFNPTWSVAGGPGEMSAVIASFKAAAVAAKLGGTLPMMGV